MEQNIKIHNQIKEKNLRYNYEVRDIREFDCKELIQSDDIKDNIMAVLCNIKDIDKFLKRLNEKLLNLENKKREDYLRKLFYLLRLRPDIHDIYKQKQQEELVMPFIIEKERDPLYKDGLEKGIEKGIKKGLEKGIEKGIKKGIEKGIKKGKLEGKLEEQRAIAVSLLDILDDKIISEKIGLKLKEVQKLRVQNDKGVDLI